MSVDGEAVLGGGLADGVTAFDDHRLGGTVLVTFDRKAAKPVEAAGDEVNLLRSG